MLFYPQSKFCILDGWEEGKRCFVPKIYINLTFHMHTVCVSTVFFKELILVVCFESQAINHSKRTTKN
jgi:hypothetical protein